MSGVPPAKGSVTVAQYIRVHVAAARVFRLLTETSGVEAARRAVGDWERWCPAVVAGLRTKGRG